MSQQPMSEPSAGGATNGSPQTTPAATHVSPPWSLTVKVIVSVVAMLLATLVIWRFQSLIAPIVLACILAYLVNPLITVSVQRLNVSRGIGVLIVYGLLLLVAVGGGIALGYVAFDQASRLIQLLPDNIEDAARIVQEQFDLLSARTIAVGPYTFGITNLPPEFGLESLTQQALDLLSPLFSGGGTLAAQVAQATINGISIGFLVIVLSIYIAKDIPEFWAKVSDLAHQPGYRQDADRLMADFARIWDAYLRGQVILGLVIGVVVSIVLSLLGVNNALGLGVLSGVLEFLPIIGPFVGTSAAVLVAFFQSNTIWGLQAWQYALLVAAIMGLIQALENNILVPRIVGDALDLHPLLVMISVIMGASLAGILGAILAAPVVATIKLLGGYAWRKILDLPPFPEPPVEPQSQESALPFWQRLGQLRLWPAGKNGSQIATTRKTATGKSSRSTSTAPSPTQKPATSAQRRRKSNKPRRRK